MARHSTLSITTPAPLTRGGALDALRFLAAFFMVLHHYAAEAPVNLEKVHPVFARGYLATDFFIIVSGYVLGRIYGERVAAGTVSGFEFFLRRAGRVVPAHLMFALGFIAVVVGAGALGLQPLHPEWFDWRELPGQVALIQSFTPFGGKGWNAPTWSLSALLACYIAFPSIWRRLRKIRSPALALFLGLGGVLVADALALRFLGYPIYQMPMHFGLIRATPLFLLGVTLAIVSETTFVPQKSAVVLGLCSFALICGLQNVGRHDFLTIALLSFIILSAGALPAKRPSEVLARGALVSFALFISNEFVRVVYFGVEHALHIRDGMGVAGQWAVWAGGPLAAVIFAVAFHYLIDWPSQTRIKAWLENRSMKDRVSGLFPEPDPDFAPLNRPATGPSVREVLVEVGPHPAAARGDKSLNWG